MIVVESLNSRGYRGYGAFTPLLPIKRGSAGNTVGRVQEMLASLGFGIDVDRMFGPKTESAVKGFQASMGLSATGIVDRKTYDILSEYSKKHGIEVALPPPKPKRKISSVPLSPLPGLPPLPEPKRDKTITYVMLGGVALLVMFILK